MLLDVKNLHVTIGKDKEYPVINGIDLTLNKGQVIGIIGESGSGKSITVKALLGLLPKSGKVTEGEVWFEDIDLLKLHPDDLRKYLGNDFGMVFQNPMTSLNPLIKIKKQISEVIKKHNSNMSLEDINKRVKLLLEKVQLPDPEVTGEKFPHQLSGGQKQRVLIAIALANRPKILVADEATTALDVTVQFQIIKLIKTLLKENDMSMIFISHDLSLVNQVANYIYIMYTGVIVECGTAEEIFNSPMHPYTVGLIRSLPEFAKKGEPIPIIPGRVPALEEERQGCSFYPRCQSRAESCLTNFPKLKKINRNHFVRCHMVGGDNE